MQQDAALLQDYVQTGSDSAFRELVLAHFDLVHAAALRRVNGDVHLAQDLAQTVFTDLARKARNLPPGTVLAGWLYRHTCFQAAEAVRASRRRVAREQTAALLQSMDSPAHDSEWEELVPLMDEVLGDLTDADRDALVLRFFERGDFRGVGAALGVSEDTAQKRVSRALDRLRSAFLRRGITSTASALAGALGTHAVTPAPLGLAAQVASASFAASAAASTGGVAGFLALFMGLTKFQTAVACIVLAAAPIAFQQWGLNDSADTLTRLLDDLRRQRDSLATASATHARLERQADQLERSRQQWQREGEIVAATHDLRGDPSREGLYRWNDEAEFVRLPRWILAEVAIREWEGPASVGKDRETKSPLDPEGRPSALLMTVLGISEGDQKTVTDYCLGFLREYENTARNRSRFATELPEGISEKQIRPQGELRLRITEPLSAEESRALRANFRRGLAERVGTGAAEAFWHQMARDFESRCDAFGSVARLLGVRRNPGGGDRPEYQWTLIRMHRWSGAWKWDGEVHGVVLGRPELLAELAAGPAVRFETSTPKSSP